MVDGTGERNGKACPTWHRPRAGPDGRSCAEFHRRGFRDFTFANQGCGTVGAAPARLHLVLSDDARRIDRMPQRVFLALAALCLVYCCPAPLRAAPPPYA